MSTLDSSWVVSSGANGLAAHNSPAWLELYLSVCKLLDLALALPAHKLPQFQMYRWAFVSEGIENNNVDNLIGTQSGGPCKPVSLTNGVETGIFTENRSSNQTSISTSHQKQLYQQGLYKQQEKFSRALSHLLENDKLL